MPCLQLRTAEQLLLDLNRRLDQPITWELKRQLVETPVEGVWVETVESNGKKEAITHVRFGSPDYRQATWAVIHTQMDAAR